MSFFDWFTSDKEETEDEDEDEYPREHIEEDERVSAVWTRVRARVTYSDGTTELVTFDRREDGSNGKIEIGQYNEESMYVDSRYTFSHTRDPYITGTAKGPSTEKKVLSLYNVRDIDILEEIEMIAWADADMKVEEKMGSLGVERRGRFAGEQDDVDWEICEKQEYETLNR